MCRFNARITGQPPAAANVAQGSFDDMLVDDLSEFNWWDSVEDLTFPLECGDLKAAAQEGLAGSPLKSEQEADSTCSNLELLELLRGEEAAKGRAGATPAASEACPTAPGSPEEAVGFASDNAAALLQAQQRLAQTQQIAAVQQLAQAAQLQLQAPLLAAMQASQAAQQLQQPNFAAPGAVATGVPQVPQSQPLEQLLALSGAAAMGAPFANPLVNNLPMMLSMRNLVNQKSTAVELDETVEKIKKKRRESAQRSRQRKNAYMKSLEVENKALRNENGRLKEIISRLDRSFLSAAVADIAAVQAPAALPAVD